MSNILVIEPRKILQHATAIALFPDHETHVVDSVPEGALVEERDAVIVDAVTLRETNALSAQTVRAMEEWTVPMVWIDADPPQAPNSVNLVIVKRPVSRDELRAALAACLGRELMSRAGADAGLEQGARGSAKTTAKKAGTAPAQKPQVIDLVEVVEETNADTQSKGKK
ncbi:MAG: hypothetical protein ACREQV_18080 [Candidatus Binatia bacterium]